MRISIKWLAALCFATCFVRVSAQMPVPPPASGSAAEHQQYQTAKEDWVRSHPEEYARISGNTSVLTTKAVEAKTPANEASTVGFPEGFPVYKSTGNVEADNAAYQKAKEAYYAKSSPEAIEYARKMEIVRRNDHVNVGATAPAEAKTVTADASRVGFPEGFPVFRNTGNPEADNAAYEKAKNDYYASRTPEALEAARDAAEKAKLIQSMNSK